MVAEALFSALRPSAVELAVLTDGQWRSYALKGVLAELVSAYWWDRTPVGIVIDRLEEHPQECQAPEGLVLSAVAWLRAKYPNGV